MKEKILNTLSKFLIGFYSVKIKKDLYLNFPKLAPIFTLAFLLYFLGENNNLPLVTYFSYFLIIFSIFGFFFDTIFSHRKPKNPF